MLIASASGSYSRQAGSENLGSSITFFIKDLT